MGSFLTLNCQLIKTKWTFILSRDEVESTNNVYIPQMIEGFFKTVIVIINNKNKLMPIYTDRIKPIIVHVYIYIYIFVCVCVYVHVYKYRMQ